MPADQYCTYFDHRYAGQALAMIRSLRAQGGTGTVWALCLSEAAEAIVHQFGLADVRTVRLAEVEAHFPGLAAAKADRSTIEYYFTLTPHIVRYVFDRAPDAKRVAYLDGDLYFFGTAVRIHRAGEEATYTGLKPAGLGEGPVIPSAAGARNGAGPPCGGCQTES